MLLLMSDNVDRCFESCPPRTFLPALCRIFLDEEAPDQVSINVLIFDITCSKYGRSIVGIPPLLNYGAALIFL